MNKLHLFIAAHTWSYCF